MSERPSRAPSQGQAIENESYRLIEAALAGETFPEGELPIIHRIVHATGDPSIAATIRIHPEAIARGVAALAAGKPVITDVEMLKAGVTHAAGEVLCAIRDGDVAAAAKTSGGTRAIAAMQKLKARMNGAIIAIGNAPTALFEVIALAQAGEIDPAVIVGMPVGFVGAAESKAALIASGLPYISNVGNRGGSSMAASAVNALAKLAKASGASVSATAKDAAQKGHVYLLGIGPGAPDLLTLRAKRLIETADVVIAPRSDRGAISLALETIRPHLAGQEVIEKTYPMTRENAGTRSFWAEVAEEMAHRATAGAAVVQVTIGDPLIYSTSSYLLAPLRASLAPEKIHLVSGISAFQAGAAALGEILTLQEDRLTLMSATNLEAVEEALEHCETLVLYKAGQRLKEIAALLERKGLLENASLAAYVEQEGKEVLLRGLASCLAESPGYMCTVLIKTGHRPWAEE